MNDQPQPKRRSRKIYILWGVALTLLVTAALFCWLVVVPVWQVNTVIPNVFGDESLPAYKWYDQHEKISAAIKQLGGRKAARRKLVAYYKVMPVDPNPNGTWEPSSASQEAFRRSMAVLLLGHVDSPPVPLLIQALEHRDGDVRCAAVLALERIGPPAREAVPALQALLVRRGKSFPGRGDIMQLMIRNALRSVGSSQKKAQR